MIFYRMLCCIPNWNLIISVSDTQHIEIIKKVFSGFCFEQITNLNNNNIKNCFCRITIIENQKKYCIEYIFNEKLIFNELSINDVIFLLYELIEKYFTSLDLKNYIMLHGASLSRKDTGIGLIATTRTGKSTLTTYLSNQGYNYMTDDIIIIDHRTYETIPFPLPISLRSVNLFKEKMNLQVLYEGYNEFRKEHNYFIESHYKPNCFTNRKTVGLSKIYFINRCNKLDIKKIKKSEAYINLLYNIKYSKNFDNEISNLIKLSEKIACYELYYDTLENANALINKTIEL